MDPKDLHWYDETRKPWKDLEGETKVLGPNAPKLKSNKRGAGLDGNAQLAGLLQDSVLEQAMQDRLKLAEEEMGLWEQTQDQQGTVAPTGCEAACPCLDAEEAEKAEEAEFDLESLRTRRLEQMKKQMKRLQELKALGHGEYSEIVEEEFLPCVTKSPRAVVHFFHREFETCKVMDLHWEKIAAKVVGTRFVKLNAEKAPFFVTKLQVRTLPTSVFFVDGVAVHRITGLEGLAAAPGIPFPSSRIMRVLQVHRMLKETPEENVQAIGVEEEEGGGQETEERDQGEEREKVGEGRGRFLSEDKKMYSMSAEPEGRDLRARHLEASRRLAIIKTVQDAQVEEDLKEGSSNCLEFHCYFQAVIAPSQVSEQDLVDLGLSSKARPSSPEASKARRKPIHLPSRNEVVNLEELGLKPEPVEGSVHKGNLQNTGRIRWSPERSQAFHWVLDPLSPAQRSRIDYDIASEDEEIIQSILEFRQDKSSLSLPLIALLFDSWEKASLGSLSAPISSATAWKIAQARGLPKSMDAQLIAEVYRRWLQKRKKKGRSLLRYFWPSRTQNCTEEDSRWNIMPEIQITPELSIPTPSHGIYQRPQKKNLRKRKGTATDLKKRMDVLKKDWTTLTAISSMIHTRSLVKLYAAQLSAMTSSDLPGASPVPSSKVDSMRVQITQAQEAHARALNELPSAASSEVGASSKRRRIAGVGGRGEEEGRGRRIKMDTGADTWNEARRDSLGGYLSESPPESLPFPERWHTRYRPRMGRSGLWWVDRCIAAPQGAAVEPFSMSQFLPSFGLPPRPSASSLESSSREGKISEASMKVDAMLREALLLRNAVCGDFSTENIVKEDDKKKKVSNPILNEETLKRSSLWLSSSWAAWLQVEGRLKDINAEVGNVSPGKSSVSPLS